MGFVRSAGKNESSEMKLIMVKYVCSIGKKKPFGRITEVPFEGFVFAYRNITP